MTGWSSVSGAALVAVVLTASCGSDGRTLREPVYAAPEMTTSSDTVAPVADGEPGPTVASTAVPVLPAEPTAGAVVIDRLSSPANAIAEVEGTGATSTDLVTVDGDLADVVSFDRGSDGTFLVRIRIEEEGAHTVCVAAACGRLYTREPGAESPDEVRAKIDQALVAVGDHLDIATEFPDWAVEVDGTFSGTAGSTDVDTRTITIHRNRGRTVDDFVRTILHEFGHAADHDRLTDDERMEYLRLRGLDPTSSWSGTGGHRVDDWALRPNEDFAESMVSIWSDGRWTSRTDGVGPPPDAVQLARIAELAAD